MAVEAEDFLHLGGVVGLIVGAGEVAGEAAGGWAVDVDVVLFAEDGLPFFPVAVIPQA